MKYGLIGRQLSYTFSPQIHQKLFGYKYEVVEVAPEALSAVLLDRNFLGVNITAPYKETVIPYLDEIDACAQAIGAVNTIVNRQGKLYGYNTDFNGLMALIVRAKLSLQGKKVLVLGSGGTSKTAQAVARHLGSASVVRVSRTGNEDCVTYEQAKARCADAQILINTTPCGMYPDLGMPPVNVADFPKLEGVVDVVYNPLRTRLVCDALRRGIPAVGGLYMLVAQAAYAGALFTDAAVAQESIDAVYRSLCLEISNPVLIGMPGCGKTTVGRRLAEQLGRSFVDTDDVIVRQCGDDIPTVFAQIGESGFRNCESAVIREVARQRGVVIATGGGTVLRDENIELLKQNGRIYFMDRDMSLLTITEDRPLSATMEDLQKRYAERYALYTAACDVHVAANGTVDEVANLIREDFLYETIGH